MTVAAYAIGASQGFLYLRGEYRYLLERARGDAASAGARANLLGNGICGQPGFDFDIRDPRRRGLLRLRRGVGAHRVARGQARRAAQSPAVSGHERLQAAADDREQRRDAVRRGADRGARRRLVPLARHAQVVRHQDPVGGRRRARGPASTSIPFGVTVRAGARGLRRRRTRRRCRSAARPASASTPPSSAAASPSRTCRRPARSRCSTRAATCSRWRATTRSSSRTRAAGSARRAASAPRCWWPRWTRSTPATARSTSCSEMNRLNQVLLMSAHCGLGHTACNPILDTLKRFRPGLRAQAALARLHAGVRPRRRARPRAADDRPRRRRRAPGDATVNERPDLPARRRRSAVRARPDGAAGGARGRPLHPAPVLPPGVHAARQLQGVHGQGQRPTDGRVHDAGRVGDRGRERHRRTERPAPHAGADAVRRGQPLLPVLREERQLRAAGARLRSRGDDRGIPAPVSGPSRGCLAPRDPARLQPLHPLRAVRARVARGGRQARLLAGRPRPQQAPDRERGVGPARRHRRHGHRQGRRGLPGGRDPAQARRVRRRRSAQRRYDGSPDQRAGAGRRAAPAGRDDHD